MRLRDLLALVVCACTHTSAPPAPRPEPPLAAQLEGIEGIVKDPSGKPVGLALVGDGRAYVDDVTLEPVK